MEDIKANFTKSEAKPYDVKCAHYFTINEDSENDSDNEDDYSKFPEPNNEEQEIIDVYSRQGRFKASPPYKIESKFHSNNEDKLKAVHIG